VELTGAEVHVWWSRPSEGCRLRHGVADVLAADELEWVQSLRAPGLRRARAWTQAWLRHVLGGYAELHPAALPLERGKAGKPRLACDSERARGGVEGSAPGIRFNLSRSGRIAVLVVTRGGEVGIDVERIAPRRSLDVLIDACCSPAERRALGATHPASALRAFLVLWTRKEAYLKGLGTGLSLDPRQIRIEATESEGASAFHSEGASRASHPREDRTESWTLFPLSAPPGYVATLSVSFTRPAFRVFGWSPSGWSPGLASRRECS
jgi:4'-phosphopantetheinyl transferase